jgi:hypothetical protein
MLSEAIPVGAAAKVDQPVFAVVDDNVCDGLTTLYKSVVTARRTIDDNFESEEEYKKPLARSQVDTEVNDVMECIYWMRREKDVVEMSHLVMNGRVSGEKRNRDSNLDVYDDESVEDDPSFTRTLVYSADVKDLVCDNHHETIEKSPKIEKVLKDAIRYLSYVPSIYTIWSKNEVWVKFVCSSQQILKISCSFLFQTVP